MPINTPETDQAIGAQEAARGGDFSARNLPSAAGLPMPNMPIFGTGENVNRNPEQTNAPVPGTNVDANFLSKVLGVKDDPYKVGKLPEFTQDQVYNPRYSSFLPGANNEERAANAQSTWNKWGNAFVKFGATTIGTFYNGMTAIPSSIMSIKDGTNPYSGDNSNSIDTWLGNLENEFPNYYTKWEQDHPFLSALPFSGGAANFWGDKMLKNLGFTVGAIASAVVTDWAIGLATGGIGEAPMVGAQTGKAALWLNKIFGAGKVAELGSEAGASADAILTAQNLKRVSGLSQLKDGTRYALNSYAAAASEAGFEARDGYNTTKNDLITAYKNEKGYSPFGKDADDIETAARAGANVRFLINLGLLGASNAIQFDNLLKPWNIAKTGARSSIELAEAGRIGLKEGSLDVFETQTGGKFRRFADFSRPFLANALAEGVYEEGGQYAAQVGTQNYYERRYLAEHKMAKSGYSTDQTAWDSRNDMNNFLHSTMEGMKAQFGTTEGQENMFLGALTGWVSEGAKFGYDRFTGKGDPGSAHREEVLSFLNRNGVTGTVTNLYDEATSSHRIAQDMKASVTSGDLFQYKNYQHEMFSKFITSALQVGRFDVRMLQLDLLKDMDQEKFKAAFGMDKTADEVKTVGQYVDLMKEKAHDVKRTYDLINDTFGNPYNKYSKSQDDIENYHTFENYKSDLTYLASIQKDVKSRQTSINDSVKKIDPRLDMNVLRTLTDRTSLTEYTKTLQEQYDNLIKAAEIKESPTKKEDAKEAKDLKKKLDLINDTLSNPKPTNAQYEKLFKTVLDHNINGYSATKEATPAYDVPPESIPALINYGRDSNRLTRYSESASNAFEGLAEQDGVDKYFRDKIVGDQAWRKANPFQTTPPDYTDNPLTKQPEQQTEKPTQGPTPEATTVTQTPTNTPIPTPPVATITVTSKDGKKSRTFEQGKVYFINTGEKPEKITIESVNPDGSITVKNDADETKNITVDQALQESQAEQDLDEVIRDTNNPDTNNPPPTNEVNGQPPKSESSDENVLRGSAKDLADAPLTSTDPEYSNQATGYNHFQQRHQRFLFNLQSNNNNEINQANKNNIRAIYINKKMSLKMGFPEEFIEDKKYTGDNEPIRIAYVIRKDKTSYFVDEHGNETTAINAGKVDPANIIFTTAIGSNLGNYTNKQNLDVDKVKQQWIEKRRKIIAIDSVENIPLMKFKVSRGIINASDNNNRNAVEKVGLVHYSDFDRSIISISTLNSITPQASGEVKPILDGIYFKSGRTLLNPGLTISWLDARKINEKEAENLFQLLRYIPQKKSKVELGDIVRYMRGVIYMADVNKAGTQSSIALDKMGLYLGTDRENPIYMSVDELDKNKDKIVNFLKEAYHNVDKSRLEEKFNPKQEFKTLKVEGLNLVTDKSFKNYNHYLLSDEGGRTDVPLTSTLNQKVDNTPPFIQKYIQIDGDGFDSSAFKAVSQPITETVTKTESNTSHEQGVKDVTPNPPADLKTIAKAEGVTSIAAEPYIIQGHKVYVGDIKFDDNGNVNDLKVFALVNPVGKISKPDPQVAAVFKQILLQNFQKSQITKDETNTTEKKSLKDKLKDKGVKPRESGDSGIQYRTVYSDGRGYEKINIDQEYATFRHVVGDKYTLNKLDHLLRKTNGGFAWGAVQGAMLYVYNEAPTGTLYHEAFEAVWGNFLTGKEQQELYNEFKGKTGTFTTFNGEVKNYNKASVLEAKEQMAEDFAQYRLNKDQAKENLKSTPKLIQWFNNLINFIRKIIYGPKDEVNRLYDRMNQGYYRNYSNNITNINQAEYSTARVEQLRGLPEYMIQDTIQGMTVEMMQGLFEDGTDVVEFLDEHPKLASEAIYSKLFTRLNDYYEGTFETDTLTQLEALDKENADTTAVEQQYEQIKAQWDTIKKNWDGFKKEHQRALKVFGIEFNIDKSENEDNDKQNDERSEERQEDKNSKDYANDYLTVDAKQSASKTIKLMLASVADSIWHYTTEQALSVIDPNRIDDRRDLSSVGLAKGAQYAKLFNYLLHSAANIGNIYDVVKQLQAKLNDIESRNKSIDPNVQRFLNKIGLSDDGFKGKDWARSKVILKAEGALVKNSPNYDRQFVDNQMNVYYKQSVLNSKLNQVKQLFLAGLKSSNVVQAGLGADATMFSINEGVINKKKNIDFLHSINIPISRQEYKRFTSSQEYRFNKAVNGMRKILERVAKSGHPLDTINKTADQDFDGRLSALAEVYVEISGDDSQSQHPNLDNQQTSSFITNNFVMTQLNDLNNSPDKNTFLQQVGNKYMNDIFHQDSVMFNNMYDADGKKTDKRISFTIAEGLEAWNKDNKSLSKVNESVRSMIEINNNLNGTFYTLLPADSTTENAIKSGTFLDASTFFNQKDGKEAELQRFYTQMYGWLRTEVNLAKDFKTNKNRQNIVALNRVNSTDETRTVGNSLRFFQDLFPPELVKEINRDVIDGDKDINKVIDRQFFEVVLRNHIESRANDQLRYFEDWNLFKTMTNGTDIAVSGLDKAFLNEHLGKNLQDVYSKSDIINLMGFREINYIVSNIDMHKMFFGDPAQYKDELKRIKSFLSGRDLTHTDIYQDTSVAEQGFNANATLAFNKVGNLSDPNTMVSLKPGDPGYKAFSNTVNTATFEDVFSASENENEEYQHINEADSQSWMMPTFYRELMMKSAWRWTNAQERQYQRDRAWERLDMEKDGLYKYTDQNLKKMDEKLSAEEKDNKVAYQPLKIIHSGMQDANGVAVASLDKSSWQMLSYKWFKGQNLGHLYQALLNKNLDYVRVVSAHKVGTQTNSLTSLYDEKGNFNKEGVQGVQTEQILLKHLGIQVEQAKKESGQTEGSQARKVVTMDTMNNGIPVDYKGTPEEWEKLDDTQKKNQSDLYKKVKRFHDAIIDSVNIRVSNAMRKLGITKNEEDKYYTIEDKTKLSKFILSELERRDLPRNIALGLQIDPVTLDFNTPLEANAQYQKIRQIIYSTIEKAVQRPKFNGGMKTLVSATGFESGPRIVKKMVNNKPVFTSDLLKFYKQNDKGTEACEIMLPYYFEKKLMAAQKNGAPLRSKQEVLNYLKTKEGQEVLKGIGFRIPTQGMNSLDFFVVKDFLDENMGDSVVFPAEITKKAGSDFDIDKMNLYIKNFYIDHATGFPTLVTKGLTKNINTNDEQQLRDFYEQHLLEKYKEYNNWLKQRDTEQRAEKLLNATGLAEAETNEDEEEEPEYVPGIDEFILENKGKPAGSIGMREVIENEYMDAMSDLISDPHNYNSLIKSNSAADLKRLRNDIVNLKETKEETQVKNQPYGRLINSTFMAKERQAYLASKGVVGIAAIANTFHSLAQGTQGGLLYWGKKGFEARFPHNDKNGVLTLSGTTLKGFDNVLISNVISQIIDGGVDVTNDKFLSEMGINRETLPVVLGIVRGGGSPRWAVHFINQPIIQEFLKRKEINQSAPQLSRRISYIRKQEDIANAVKSNVRFNKPNDNLIKKGPPKFYTVGEMEDMIKVDNLNTDQRAKQWQMLDDYRQYVNMGWDMFNYYTGYNWDTGNFGDPNMTRIKNLAYQRASGQSLNMTPVNQLMKDSFLDAMRKGVWQLDNGFKSVINVQRGVAGQILTNFAKKMQNWFGAGIAVKQQALLKLEIGMIDYSNQNSQKTDIVPLVDQMSDLMMGHSTTAHYIQAIQDSGIEKLVKNPLIANLVPKIDPRTGFPSTISLKERDYDTYTSNVWTDSFRELKDNNKIIYLGDFDEEGKPVSEVYNMLVKTFMLQSGGKRTGQSGTHLIPNESYAEYLKPATQLMNLMNFEEGGSFERNNMQDARIVPYVEEETIDFNSGLKSWVSAIPAPVIALMKQENGENYKVPYLLSFGDWQANDQDYVKRYVEWEEFNEKGNIITKSQVQLYQRVTIDGLSGKESLKLTPKSTVYKPINSWGYGNNVQEHHQFGQQSILTGVNPAVNEVTDDYIIDLYQRAGVHSNAYVSSPTETKVVSNTAQNDEQSTAPVSLVKQAQSNQPKFQKINIEDVKRSGKKDFFNISASDEVGEQQGYALKVENHPDLQLYVSQQENGRWLVSDNRSGISIGISDKTAKGAISNAVDILNKYGQNALITPENEEKLAKLGVQRKYDEPDRDIGECK